MRVLQLSRETIATIVLGDDDPLHLAYSPAMAHLDPMAIIKIQEDQSSLPPRKPRAAWRPPAAPPGPEGAVLAAGEVWAADLFDPTKDPTGLWRQLLQGLDWDAFLRDCAGKNLVFMFFLQLLSSGVFPRDLQALGRRPPGTPRARGAQGWGGPLLPSTLSAQTRRTGPFETLAEARALLATHSPWFQDCNPPPSLFLDGGLGFALRLDEQQVAARDFRDPRHQLPPRPPGPPPVGGDLVQIVLDLRAMEQRVRQLCLDDGAAHPRSQLPADQDATLHWLRGGQPVATDSPIFQTRSQMLTAVHQALRADARAGADTPTPGAPGSALECFVRRTAAARLKLRTQSVAWLAEHGASAP